MVARVLVINEYKLDVSQVSSKLQDLYCSTLFAKSLEDALRIISSQFIDVVFLFLPKDFYEGSSKLFFDFFSILRQLCGVIPIIGLTESNEQKIPSIELEDIICVGINRFDLLRRINLFVKMKNLFDDNLLSNMYLEERNAQKIVTIFHNNVDFLHKSIFENTEIVVLRTWPMVDNVSDADLFIININHTHAHECCANLRLRKINKYKPIVFTFDKFSEEKVKQAIELDIGFTDIIDSTSNPLITKCRLNSLIKYKKLYDAFSKKLKKSLYLSTIDSITEIYNRSFFEDYLKNKDHNFSNSAIIMLDVDKFKLINDKYGHSFADSVLKYVSNTIKRCIRSSDIVARYGGDEFIILMRDITRSTAENVVNRVQKKISDFGCQNIKCSVSIGMCYIERVENTSIYEAILIADKFMYIAKQSGGNSVRVCA
ncbi:MAG: diguanylate cyclase [Holosporaceae bacterium]|jgi:diguanylate cyclase (GGDEF)-like protein|nr:diguanylate cyclase [Holosporaceae bacterium]